eukprot:8359349-Lingulodinium_polyedra.AAC.1
MSDVIGDGLTSRYISDATEDSDCQAMRCGVSNPAVSGLQTDSAAAVSVDGTSDGGPAQPGFLRFSEYVQLT